MKNMKKLVALFLSAIMVFTLVACGASEAPAETPAETPAENTAPAETPAEAPTYDWIANCTMKTAELTGNSAGIALKYFVDQVNERSNGQIKIKLYPDAQLASSTDEVMTGALTGAFQVFNIPIGNIGGYTDAFRALDVPYLYLNSEQVYTMMDTSLAEDMRSECIEDCGVRILTFLDLGFRQLTNSVRPIKTPEDMVGLKFRVMSTDNQIALFENFGCSTVTTAFSELYSALQQNLVDGQDNPILNVYNSKLYENQKYMTLTNHNYTFTSIAISEEAYQTLTPELQELVDTIAYEAELVSREEYAKLEAGCLEEIGKTLDIYYPTTEELLAFQEKASAIWPRLQESFGDEYWNYLMDLSANALK